MKMTKNSTVVNYSWFSNYKLMLVNYCWSVSGHFHMFLKTMNMRKTIVLAKMNESNIVVTMAIPIKFGSKMVHPKNFESVKL